MRHILVAAAAIAGFALICTGCAMQKQVQRQTVEYNTAVFGMANQLTLLNIARAKEGLPTFYTSISRLTGTITVKTAASFGAQIKASQPTTTSSTSDQNAANNGTTTSTMTGGGGSSSTQGMTGSSTTSANSTGSSGDTLTNLSSNSTQSTNGTSTSTSSTTGGSNSMASTITSLVQMAVAHGGNVYSPSVSGEIDSGPSFDIEILDTQPFYRGILAGIDGATLMNFLDQGVDGDLIFRLMIYKVAFKATSATGPFLKGQVVHTWTNAPLSSAPEGEDDLAKSQSSTFWSVAQCYELATQQTSGEETNIALVSRVVTVGGDKPGALKLSELTSLGGDQLALKSVGDKPPADKSKVYIGSPDTPDDKLLIVKPAQAKEIPALYLRPAKRCQAPDAAALKDDPKQSRFYNEAIFTPKPGANGDFNESSNRGELRIFESGILRYTVPVEAEIVPRSTEAVIQYLGAYARAYSTLDTAYELGGAPLFAMHETKCKAEVVGADIGHQHYCIEHEDHGALSMRVIGLVEQLIDLNKSGLDRPGTLPVQVVP
jgi:hypothetical protein